MMDIVEFAETVLKIKLFPYQAELLRRAEKGERVILVTRSPGKRAFQRIWDEYRQYRKIEEGKLSPDSVCNM